MKNIQHYRVVHQENEKYGTGMDFHFPYIAAMMIHLHAKSLVNFGCGKSQLANQLQKYGLNEVCNYDPAIPELSNLPSKEYDVLINTDVLEHIPEPELDGVLQTFKKLSATSINIPDLQKAKLILPNGENAHCTLKTPDEWRLLFARHYKHVIVLPHHSKRHTIIFATDIDISLDQLRYLHEVILFTRKEYTLKNFGMTQPFRRRLRAAVRLLRGNTGFTHKKY